ncbi:hypothetical protein RKD49_002056 [Streptomyces glaucescens]
MARDAQPALTCADVTIRAGRKLDPAFAEKLLNFIIAEVIRHHERIAEDAVNGQTPTAG